MTRTLGDIVAFVARMAATGFDAVEAMRQEERERGAIVVKPGDTHWLPLHDWTPDCVVSIRDLKVVRLILLVAVAPGGGALQRLFAQLDMLGVGIEIIYPSRRFADHLTRHGWRCAQRWTADHDREEVWTR